MAANPDDVICSYSTDVDGFVCKEAGALRPPRVKRRFLKDEDEKELELKI